MNKMTTEPIYIHISKILKSEIFNGIYPDGSYFPSENELTARFSVTRNTIRNAVNLLVRDGLLNKQQGKRITVCLNKVMITSWNFRSFSDGMRSQQNEPVSKVLGFEEIFLNAKPYYRLTRIRGIRLGVKNQYLTKEVSHLPKEIFKDINKFDFENLSLYEVMRKEYNIFPSTGQSELTAILCPEDLASFFELSVGSPIIKAHQKIQDTQGRKIEIVDIFYSPYLKINISRDCGH